MGTFDSLLNKDNKKKDVDFSKNTFVSLMGDKKTSFKERLTGTPTKNYNNTYKANTGIIPVVKEIGKSLFQGTVGTGESLGQSISVNRGDFDALNKANEQKSTIKLNLVKKINENKKLGRDNTALIKAYNSMSGPDETIQTLAPATTKTKGQVLGELGLMGAGMLGAGSVSVGAKSLGLLGSQAEKLALKQLTAQQLKRNLIKDVALNTGVGYASDVSRNFADGNTSPGAFKPGIGTVAGFTLPGLLGNANMNKILTQQSQARIASKYAQEFNIPSVGKPSLKLESPDMRTARIQSEAIAKANFPKQGEGVIPLQEPGILESQARLREQPKIIKPETPKTRLEQKAAANMNRQNFIESERNSINLAKNINKTKSTKGSVSNIPTITDKQLGKIWDDAHAIQKDSPLKKVEQYKPTKVKQEIPTQPTQEIPSQTTKDIPNTEQPKTGTDYEPNWSRQDGESFKKDIPNHETFSEGTFKEWSSTLRNIDKTELENVALGGEKTIPTTIPKTAYYSVLKNIAKETNDVDLSIRLANSPVRSKGGQELVANQMSASENIVDDLVEIKKSRAKQRGISDVKYTEEVNTILQSIKTKIQKMKNTIPTEQEIDDIINKLICK